VENTITRVSAQHHKTHLDPKNAYSTLDTEKVTSFAKAIGRGLGEVHQNLA
jgi:hypothetical protein